MIIKIVLLPRSCYFEWFCERYLFNCMIAMGILIMNFMFIGELLVPSFRNYLVFANKTSKLEKFVALSQYACVCLNMHVLVCSCRVIFGRRGNLMSTSIYAGYTYHLIASIHMNFLLPKL